jgi:hypothetical protein
MVTVNENIRFYKPNDPYFYEVDNLPLIDLLNNDKTLADAINDILLTQANYATELFVQQAVGDSTVIDIDGDGVTIPNNVIQWVLSKNYATTLEALTDTDLTDIENGDVLVFDSGTFRPGTVGGANATFFPEPLMFFQDMQYGVIDTAPPPYQTKPAITAGGSNGDPNGNYLGRPNGEGLTSTGTLRQASNYDSVGELDPFHPVAVPRYKLYDIMKDQGSGNFPNFKNRSVFTFRRTYAECGLPANTRSIFLTTSITESAEDGGNSKDRLTRLLIRNTNEVSNSKGTGFPALILNEAYSNYNDGDNTPLQNNTTAPETEVFMGPFQRNNQYIEIEVQTTAFASKEPDTDGYPTVSLVITGYTVD